ncbi:MAG: hypothetical protein ACPHSD_01800 [Candidatus Latescibacterota bacterium]
MNTPLHTSRQRIVQLLVNELRDRRRLVWLAPLVVIFSFFFLYFAPLFELKYQNFAGPFVIMFYTLIPVAFMMPLSKTLETRSHTAAYFMLPASLREKLAIQLLLGIVGGPLFCVLWGGLLEILGLFVGQGSAFPFGWEWWNATTLSVWAMLYTGALSGQAWSGSSAKQSLKPIAFMFALASAPVISTAILFFLLEKPSVHVDFSVVAVFFSLYRTDSLLVHTLIIIAHSAVAAAFAYLTYLRMRDAEV